MGRSLLSIFPAASALLAFRANGSPVPQPAFTDAGFSICVQCWSFKEFTVCEAIEMAAAAGAGGIEFFPGQCLGEDFPNAIFGPAMTESQVQSTIAHLTKHHITALNFGVIPIPNNEAEARKIFTFAKKFNLHGITTESLSSLDIIESLAAEFDLKVGFHNHPKPTALWHPDTIWKALDGRHLNIGYCADIGHWASSGLDPSEIVRKIAPRIHSFHFKDRSSIQEPSRDQPLGTGIIDLPSILDEVRRHGFRGNVSIEYEYNWKTNLPEFAQCVGYLRAYSKLRTCHSGVD